MKSVTRPSRTVTKVKTYDTSGQLSQETTIESISSANSNWKPSNDGSSENSQKNTSRCVSQSYSSNTSQTYDKFPQSNDFQGPSSRSVRSTQMTTTVSTAESMIQARPKPKNFISVSSEESSHSPIIRRSGPFARPTRTVSIDETPSVQTNNFKIIPNDQPNIPIPEHIITDLALMDCPPVPMRTSSEIRASLNLQRIKENDCRPVDEFLQRVSSVKPVGDQIQEQIPVEVSYTTKSSNKNTIHDQPNATAVRVNQALDDKFRTEPHNPQTNIARSSIGHLDHNKEQIRIEKQYWGMHGGPSKQLPRRSARAKKQKND